MTLMGVSAGLWINVEQITLIRRDGQSIEIQFAGTTSICLHGEDAARFVTFCEKCDHARKVGL